MDVLQNIGIDIFTMVSLVAYIVRMEMKQKELVARRKEDKDFVDSEIEKLEEATEKLEIIMHERVNIVKGELKEDRKENQAEFKEINSTLAEVKADTKAILRALNR
jgi:hypothetical protein